MRRYFFVIVLAAVSALGTGCGKSERPAPPATAKAEQPVEIPAAQKKFFEVEAAGASQAVDVISLPGRVTFRPQAQSAVGATTVGRVVALLVRAGEVVKAGTPLLTIDSTDAAAARATLDQSATRMAANESVYKRTVEMVEKGVGLEVERQEAEAKLKEARAEHERAQHTVAMMGAGQGNRVTVRAPSNGVVMAIHVAVGATVAPGGEPLVELGDPSRLQIVAQVTESDLRRIGLGQQAEVELPALATRFPAKVESFSPRVDPESRRTQVYLELAKPGKDMRAGMLAQISLRVGTESDIMLPVSAVLIKDGKRRVVYVERLDGTYEVRDVQIGRNVEGRVVILKGLAAGEKVVVRGALLLDSQAELLL